MVKGREIIFVQDGRCNYCRQPVTDYGPYRAAYCTNVDCDPHGRHDPRRCPSCGCGYLFYLRQCKGVVTLQCPVCGTDFDAPVIDGG